MIIRKVIVVFFLVFILTAIYTVVNKNRSTDKNIISTDLAVQTGLSQEEITSNTQNEIKSDQVENIKLIIDEPGNGSILNTANIQVKGITVPFGEVSVNDQVTKADKEGNFMVNLTLDEGDNNLLIVANDDKGNYSEKEIKVSLESVE